MSLNTTEEIVHLQWTYPIICMNTHGPNCRPTPTQRRKGVISDVINQYLPIVMCVQEFRWKNIHSKRWRHTPIPRTYAFTGGVEAGILYDTERIECIPLATTGIADCVAKRICIRLLKTKETRETPNFQAVTFLCVSWHGMYKKKERIKKKHFRDLQTFLNKLSNHHLVPVLLCGDFNLNITLAMYLVSPNFILYHYEPSDRRSTRVVDFFMTSQSLRLPNIRFIDFTEDTAVEEPEEVLDHDPLLAS